MPTRERRHRAEHRAALERDASTMVWLTDDQATGLDPAVVELVRAGDRLADGWPPGSAARIRWTVARQAVLDQGGLPDR